MDDFDFDTEIDRGGVGSIKWAAAGGGQIPLGLADMDFRAAPAIVEALQRRVDHGVYGYTDAQSGQLDAICEWTAARRGWALEVDWITPCSGVIPSIAFLLRGALGAGDGVIVHTPAFFPIVDVIRSNGMHVIENPLQIRGGRYEIDFDAFRTAASRPNAKAFVLCSPHNPSGRVWSETELAMLADIAHEHGLVVLSDEIHCETVFSWANFTTYAKVARHDDPFAVCFGPSKGFNLATLQTSVTAIAHDGLRESFRAERHKMNVDFGVSALGAVALQAAYTEGGPWLDALTRYLERNLDTLSERLAEVSEIAVVRPDASFLVWLDCRALALSDDELIDRFLNVADVIVEPGTSFGAAGSGFVRINIGTTQSRIAKAAEQIALAFSR